MKMNRASVFRLAGSLCVVLFAATIVQAAPVVPINDLYNTGMSSPWNAGVQTPLPGTDHKLQGTPNINDPHWDVVIPPQVGPSTPGGTVATRVFDDRDATDTNFVNPFAIGPTGRFQRDLAHDPARATTDLDNSQWIRPDTTHTFNAKGSYIFETTFSTNQLTTTISISGFLKSFDVTGIQLNGGPIIDPIAQSGFNEYRPFTPARPFTITGTGGLTNTLRFYVEHPGLNFLAFRVQFTNATFTIPEPSTLALGALGLVGFGVTRLRRRRTAPQA